MSLAAPGCSFLTGEKKVTPPPLEYTIVSPYDDMRTLAIAPAINLSGSHDFDPLVVSDTLFAEMQQVQGLNVLPVNKTLLAMQRLRIHSIDDPRVAQQLAEMLGADGIVIPAITAYDPYNPPTVGMILQLYTPESHAPTAAKVIIKDDGMDHVRSNPDSPMIVADSVGPVAPRVVSAAPVRQPVAQVSAVFNASNQSVLHELQVFAGGRTQYDSALMEGKFMMDADQYMRFVAHAMIRRLLELERNRQVDR